MNAYQYAPNPMTWVDPWGLSSKDECRLQLYWPPNRGFAKAPVNQTLPEGYEISRYGGFVGENGVFRDYGTFVAPKDVPYPMRALPPGTDARPLSVYKVVKEIPEVPSGPAAPYFGELGGGIQHEIPLPIQKYIDSGQIEVIGREIPGS
ncbi:TNT domain-containing protein [Limnobacter sp.]|uniref:TNT domain-containing protein n=1 Tax=Limnobacter sp. TaxID=2003368 RepID=UPI003FA5D298